ncbi:hypothetical protein SM091_004233 [Cronobacter sakazakii]|nr:hypothetical protein [Cronobacter sakazakii]ELY4757318.1 hypothetical protein [Cronobacter sakazakii]ELY4769669.1 hypothetical protein [Cronobacter sakazakii]
MDKSREQFEAWWEKEWCGEAPIDGWASLRERDGYIDEDVNAQWGSWQASRAAIEVKLPTENELHQKVCSGCASESLEMVEQAIRAAGLKVKGE